jgi:hypothetical protein
MTPTMKKLLVLLPILGGLLSGCVVYDEHYHRGPTPPYWYHWH